MSRISVLSNGIKVVTYNNGAKFGAQVGLYSNTGSGRESFGYQGKMNLLGNTIAAANPMIKSETTRSHTAFKTVAKNSESGISAIANALSSTDLSKHMEAGRAQSHAQASALDNNGAALAKEYAFKTGFGGQSLGEPTMGTSGSIDGFTAGELSGAVNSLNYHGLVLAVVGDVDHDAVAKLTDKSFGGLKSNASGGHADNGQLFTGSYYQHRFDSLDKAYCTILHHTTPKGPDAFNLAVASKLIGSWTPAMENSMHSSYNLKRRFGYVNNFYDVTNLDSFFESHCGSGVFGINLAMTGDGVRARDVTCRIQDYVTSFSRSTTKHQAARAKNALIQSVANDLQTNTMDTVATSVMNHGIVMDVGAWKGVLAGVSENTIKSACDHWLYDSEVAVGLFGCTSGFPMDFAMRARTATQFPFHI